MKKAKYEMDGMLQDDGRVHRVLPTFTLTSSRLLLITGQADKRSVLDVCNVCSNIFCCKQFFNAFSLSVDAPNT